MKTESTYTVETNIFIMTLTYMYLKTWLKSRIIYIFIISQVSNLEIEFYLFIYMHDYLLQNNNKFYSMQSIINSICHRFTVTNNFELIFL